MPLFDRSFVVIGVVRLAYQADGFLLCILLSDLYSRGSALFWIHLLIPVLSQIISGDWM